MKFDLLHPADQLVMMMDRIYNYGMTTTSGGNISILDTDGNIWITPSGVDKGNLTRDDIVLVKKDGTIVSKHKPSVEFPFHKLVYETRPDARAVLHAHPPAMVSFSLTRKVPNIRCTPTAYHICGKIGVAEYEVPGSIKLGQNIAEVFDQGYNVVMMNNHGVVVCGADVFEAFKRFETIDNCAKLNIESAKLGKIVELTDKQLSCAGARSIIPMDKFVPSNHTSAEREARWKMVTLTKRAYKQKLFTSTQGSISQRLSNSSFIITPYDKDRMYISEEDIVRVDGDKSELGKIPSRSTQLHKMIYEQHPQVNSIIIAHPVHVLAFGATRTRINTRTIPESFIMMRNVDSVPFEAYYQDNQKISDLLSDVNPLVLVENDGLIVTGSSLLNCFDRLEVADFTAKTLIDARLIGDAVAINDKDVEEIKKVFNLK